MGGLGSVATLAGCGSIRTYEFTAQPVVLPPRPRNRLGFEEVRREPVTVAQSRDVGGVQVRATVESHVAIYQATAPSGGASDSRGDSPLSAAAPNVGVVSTPSASVLGRSFNPLAHRSLPNLITSDVGNEFLRRAGLDQVGSPRERIRWERGPTFVAERGGTCVDTSTKIESYAGVLGGDPPTVAFVHLVRVDAKSIVLAAAVHGHTVSDSGRSYVGADGYLSRRAFDDAVGTFGDVCGAFRYEG